MIIRSVEKTVGTQLDVAVGNGQSRRLLVNADKMGFAVCETLVLAGTDSLLEYKNHLEACYCISGECEVEEMDGTKHSIKPGSLYALNLHDKHYLRAKVDTYLISVFNPAIEGHEKHDLKNDGTSSSY